MDLMHYLEDGANYQAQAVMCLLKGWTENILDDTYNEKAGYYAAKINVGRYENRREQGYIFSIVYDTKQRNYVVYEHRNSDEIYVIIFDAYTVTGNAPTLDMVQAHVKNKFDYTKKFPYLEIVECAKYIRSSIQDFLNDVVKVKED